jgi:transposase
VQKETGMKNNSSSDKQRISAEVERREKTPLEKSNSSARQRKTVKAVKEFGEQKLFAMAAAGNGGSGRLTIGLDLGDRSSCWCALGADGEVMARGEVLSEPQPLELFFSRIPASLVALEVGSHSPWISRVVQKLGHEVVVANTRRVKLISESSRKNDDVDAELLARLARADRQLLSPVKHRGAEAQADLMGIRVRAQLVELRTQTVNAARGLVKPMGQRLASCDAGSLSRTHAGHLEPAIRGHAERLLGVVEELTRQIDACDRELERVAKDRYEKETADLRQVPGVGPITALTFVLTLEDPARFAKSRDVGAFLGLRPKSRQSGASEPEMRISKEGDGYLRTLLVQCAQYILSRRGPDTDLKRWGLGIAAKGKKKAKKRAVVAVARKLAVLLHGLWVGGEVYERRRSSGKKTAA